MNMSESLKLARKHIGHVVTVTIDRPLGSKHPKFGFEYLVNYGYIENVTAPDGHDLDVYVLGVGESLKSFEGRCIAIVHRKDDDDDKLVVVQKGNTEWTDEDIMKAVAFQERWFDSEVIRS